MSLGRIAAWLAGLLVLALLCSAFDAYASDPASDAKRVAEQAFALLDQLSKHKTEHPNPLLGPMASLAGDADSLQQSLARNDSHSASSGIASLQDDSRAIDAALREHPDAIAGPEWNALKEEVEKLAHEIPAGGPLARADSKGSTGSGMPSVTGPHVDFDTPQILITSRQPDDGYIRLKGYIEGRALKSAGIYQDGSLVKAFKVDDIPGRQRVEFDLKIEQPSKGMILRVSDAEGRSTEQSLLQPDFQSPHGDEVSVASPSRPDTGTEPADSDESSSTAEIPSHGPLMPSPSKRHTLGSRLGDVRIEVASLARTGNLPPTYAVVGRIVGSGITRAGIYLNGRLVQLIPVVGSAKYTSFNQRFVARGDSATIRAYALGSNYVEQSIDLSDAADAASGDVDVSSVDTDEGGVITAMPPSAGIAVQITAVRPIASNLFMVSGTISGQHIASAGLYQNNLRIQNISLGTGAAGLLGEFIPGISRNINFNVRFNPYAGPAVIRAFDSTGAYTDQPIVIAGVSPYGTTFPGSAYGRGLAPPLGGSTTSRFGSKFGSSRPLW